MGNLTAIGLIIILSNFLVSYNGLKKPMYMEKYSFDVGRIRGGKEYSRLLTSGFLHGSWLHFAFNMLTFYFFAFSVEMALGAGAFLLIYFFSLIGGNLMSLYIHRNQPSYSAIGASGAVSGILFAAIAIYPGMGVGFFFIPISIPGWAFGILYVMYSIYGIKSNRDNIGHDAHLGGGLIGLVTAVALFPNILYYNLTTVLLIFVPAVVLLYIVVFAPGRLMVGNRGKKGYETVETKYFEAKRERERQLDRLLDKINKKGIESLTKEEREKLEELSNS